MNSLLPQLSDTQWLHSPRLVGHLMAITFYIQRKTMDQVVSSGGYDKLSMTFEGYIALLAERDCSPGELAAHLGISKQTCSKTVGELEKQGLIERRRNPDDSRSSLLSLTAKGRQLIDDSMAAATAMQQRFADILGAEPLAALVETLEIICRHLVIDIPSYQAQGADLDTGRSTTRLILLLPKLSDYLYRTLIAALATQGFHGLKTSFSQVLSMIVMGSGRIQYIAAVVGVSKQAIAAQATELEELGYIVRQPDPNDKRQVILQLSPLGARLMTESEASVRALESSIKDLLGNERYEELERGVSTLYFQVLDHQNTQVTQSMKIRQLADNLLAELGAAGARALAQQLTTITRGES